MKRTFIYTDEKSNKFWSIETDGTGFTVTYGKVGTSGQTQTKSFADEATCQKEAEKLIKEKTKKGYIEQDGTATAATQAAGLKTPKYKEHDEADLEYNQYVVNLKKPESIAAALKHQIDHADEFLERFYEIASEGYEGVSFGIIEDDEFVSFSNLDKYTAKNLYYDEEILAEEIAKHPELYPLTAEYIEKVILRASEEETASGPWATEETIFGQFIVPMLAERDAQYEPLLKQLVKTNVEIRCSPRFQNLFSYVEVDDDDDDSDEEEIEIETDESITDAKAINEICESVLTLNKLSAKEREQVKTFIANSKAFEDVVMIQLLDEQHKGIEIIYYNEGDDPLLLTGELLRCTVSFRNKTLYLNHTSADEGIAIKASDKFLSKVRSFVEENGHDWCWTENDFNSDFKDSVDVYEQKTDVDVYGLLNALSEVKSADAYTNNNDAVQLHNNKVLSALLKAIYDMEAFNEKERSAFEVFVSRITQYDEYYLNFMGAAVFQVVCTKGNDYQIILITDAGVGTIALMASGKALFNKYGLSPALLSYVKSFVKEYSRPKATNAAEIVAVKNNGETLDEETIKRQKKLKSLFTKALINYSEYDSNWYYKVINAYGGNRNDPYPYRRLLFEDMPVLFECIKTMPEKKVKYQTMLHNVYFMLSTLSRALPFDKVEELVNTIKEGKVPVPEQVFDGYKGDAFPDKRIIVNEIADLTDEEQVKRLLIPIVEDIDAYIKCWQLRNVHYRVDPPKHIKAWATEEAGLFDAAARFTKLHPMLEVILQKIMEANKVYPLFKEYGSMGREWWRNYVGYPIIAHFSGINPQKYDKVLLEYLQDIEAESAEHMYRLLHYIYKCWDKANYPQLPLTFKEYPQLVEMIKNTK